MARIRVQRTMAPPLSPACPSASRSADSARALRARIPAGYRRQATRSDFWLAYDEVFPRRTHRLCDKGKGETCHVERWNCTLRQRLGRFVRRTLSFSKCERMHQVAVRLFVHHYNLSLSL